MDLYMDKQIGNNTKPDDFTISRHYFPRNPAFTRYRRLRDTSWFSISNRGMGRPRNVRTPEMQEPVFDIFQVAPSTNALTETVDIGECQKSSSGDFTYVHSNPRAHRFNNGTLVLSDVEESDAGSYLCQASNGIAAGVSKIINLQVLVPPKFKEPFQTKTVTEESNTTLRCIATGHAPIVITWQKDKSLIDINRRGRFSIRDIADSRQTMSELQILKTHRNDTGTYSCSAVSDIGTDEATMQYIVQGRPDPPTDINVVNITSRSVTLQWEVKHDGNSHVTGSVIQYQSISDSSWNGQTSQLIVSGSESMATLRALSPVTLYFIRIVAENALGHSTSSEVINVTTTEEAPSGSPRDVQVHSTGAQSMKVSWKPPPDDVSNGVIKGYYVGYRISSTSEPYIFKQVERSTDGQQQSTYLTGLQPFTKYDIVVKAYNSAGAGPKSAKITGKTLETGMKN
ncbi:Down syndrome cell adhesion molecule [Araneus ventricosus]|uniref:Down syndrome cell adhesion molecule n=1 Tax=Araneus ventricosus TaxID=182803 RepID=A0A4Y2LB65_ARAVE|nr:Down syndrome cell adhesion molecule [Araneus ventricosus]